jgi:arginine/lysine/ornithine decarboxylase
MQNKEEVLSRVRILRDSIPGETGLSNHEKATWFEETTSGTVSVDATRHSLDHAGMMDTAAFDISGVAAARQEVLRAYGEYFEDVPVPSSSDINLEPDHKDHVVYPLRPRPYKSSIFNTHD